MTALARHRLAQPFRLRRLAAAVAVGIALAALTGVWTSRLVSPDGDPQAPATRVVEAGPAQLTMPAAWQPVPPAERARGLDSEQLAVLSPSSDLSRMVVATFGAPDERSLIPRALGELVDPPRSEPRVTSLAGRPAWVYRGLDARRWNLAVDVTVLPTTAGMLALACTSPAPSGDAGRGCGSSVESVSLRGVTALEPSPSAALAAQLPAMLAPLDQARVDGRAALGRARTPAAQAVALHRLGRRHQAAADRLQTAFGTAARPLIAGLEDNARAYAALGTAASAGSPARFGAARGEIQAAEAELGAAVDRVREAGTRATAPASPVPAPAAPDRPFFPPAALVLLLLVGSCLVGFALSGPLGDAMTKVRRALSSA